jgi:hypothetical protein
MVSSSGARHPRDATGTCDLAQLAGPPLVVRRLNLLFNCKVALSLSLINVHVP